MLQLPTSVTQQQWDALNKHKIAEQSRRSFRKFVEQAFKILEPQTNYVESMLGAAIAEHLEAVTKGQLKRLAISAPPQMGKSKITSVMWPMWAWIDHPHMSFLATSFKTSLAEHFSIESAKIFKSEWYQESYAIPRQMFLEKETIDYIVTNKSGSRRATAYESATGFGVAGGVLVVDDPHPVAVSDDVRTQQVDHFNKGLSNRAGATGSIVVLGQRVHIDDLIGTLIDMGGWEHLCLPNEYDPNRSKVTSIGWSDPRQDEGELLWPDVFTQERTEQAKKYGLDHYEGQYNQTPVRKGGNIFNPDDFQTYTNEMITDMRWDETIMTWDFSFSGKKGSDYVVGQVWSRHGANYYLRDQVRKQADFNATLTMFTDLCRKWPDATAKYLEESANGFSIIAAAKGRISGIIPVKVNNLDSKIGRYYAVSPLVIARNVYLPHHASWLKEFLNEAASVPQARHDDQMDAMAMALTTLYKHVSMSREIEYIRHSIY